MAVLLSWDRYKWVLWQHVPVLWLGSRLMGLQPNGAPRSWEERGLGDMGVSQTHLIVGARLMLSSVPINLVEACSEWDWEAVGSAGFASYHPCQGMLALKKQS